MATGNDLLSYTGNANLASGSSNFANADNLGVIDLSKGMEFLNKFNERKNAVADRNYQQKIADRNRTFDTIAKLEADFDKVLPENREALRKKIDDISNTLLTPGVFENADLMKEAQKKISDFNELNAYAKTNYKTVTDDMKTAAQFTDPQVRDAYQKHVQAQRDKITKDPFALYDPYSMPVEVDFKKAMPSVSPVRKVTGTDANFNDIYEEYTPTQGFKDNYNRMNTDVNYATEKQMWDNISSSWLNENRNPKMKANEIDHWNKVIEMANKKNPDATIKPIKVDANGQPDFSSPDFTIDDFNLAMYVGSNYKEGTGSAYNEEKAKGAKTASEIDENNAQAEKARQDWKTNRMKAGAYAYAMRQKGKKDKLAAVAIEKSMFPELGWDKLKSRVKSFKDPKDGKYLSRISWTDIPNDVKADLGIRPADGQWVNLVPSNVKDADGNEMNDNDVFKMYQESGYQGSIIDYLDAAEKGGYIKGYEPNLLGIDVKDNQLTQVNKLGTTQNQANRTKNKKIVLNSDGEVDDYEND